VSRGGQGERPEPVEIAPEELSPEALRGVVEAYVTREGTDYGHRDIPLEEKFEDVMRQLRRGDARIVFDPESESVTLLAQER